MEKFLVHTIAGKVVEVEGEVLRRILTQAYFGLAKMSDLTKVELRAIDWIHTIQSEYRDLI